MTNVSTSSFSGLPAVEISARAARRLAAGILWVYSNEIEGREERPEHAYWCRFTRAHRVLACGYFNRHSLIAGRVVALGEVEDISGLIEDRLRQAFMRRRPLAPGAAARLVFSEADLLPGLVIDYYPPHAVIQSNTAGMDLILPWLEQRLAALILEVFQERLAGLVVRGDSRVRQLEAVESFTRVAAGEPAALSAAAVQEDGVRYVADLVGGQKTGFFLDQRENRRHFGEHIAVRGADRVLDLYCYSGGWGLRALCSGAAAVVFVDQSREALELVERGLACNQLPADRARLICAEVFDFLARDEALYEAVVADPPAFVRSRKNLPQALKAYQKLNRLAWRRVKPGGTLYACSCSHHLSEPDFLDLLAAAVAKEGGPAQIIYRGGQAQDHPMLLSMPETAYLKCVGLRKLEG